MTRALLTASLLALPAAAAQKIGPVSGKMLQKAGRHELGAGAGLSVNDAFFQKVLVGGRYAYHLMESLALEVSGDYGISFPSGAVVRCPPAGGACRTAGAGDLSAAPGDVRGQASLSAQWAPFYGKLSVLAEEAIHFDLYFTGGGGLVSYRGQDRNGAAVSPLTAAGVVGLGTRALLSDWLTLRFDARDVIYKAQVRGDDDWQNQIELSISFSVFAP